MRFEMAPEKLLNLLTDLKDVEGVLKIALGEDCQRHHIEKAAEMLHEVVKQKEAEYWEAIEKSR